MGNSFVKVSSAKRAAEGGIRLGSVQSDEVSVVVEPGNWQRSGGRDEEEAHAMLELNFDVGHDHVTLRSVNPGAIAETRMWEHGHSRSRNSAMSAILARSASHSSFRDGIKSVGHMVKQFSNEILRTGSHNASSRVQPDASPPFLPISADPELAHNHRQNSASHAIQGLREISKATATADQRKSWVQVEARFLKLASSNHLLPRAHFAECIGQCSDLSIYFNPVVDVRNFSQIPMA